jgi:hypothetical protein
MNTIKAIIEDSRLARNELKEPEIILKLSL